MKLWELRRIVNDTTLDPDLEVAIAEWSEGHGRDALYKCAATVMGVHRDSQGYIYPSSDKRLPNAKALLIKKDFPNGKI